MKIKEQWINKSIENTHPTWHNDISQAIQAMPQEYLTYLATTTSWLPGPAKWLNAFQVPKDSIKFILYGESPYPRQVSANGYAFWDGAVKGIWSESGLDKKVNRATSLRHWLKMLLIAEGLLEASDISQTAIASISKKNLVETLNELFENFLRAGFLLLNANLALTALGKAKDQQAFLPFQKVLLKSFNEKSLVKPPILLLFGKIAETLLSLEEAKQYEVLLAKHPYNLSFATDPQVIKFFRSLHLLRKRN